MEGTKRKSKSNKYNIEKYQAWKITFIINENVFELGHL